MTSPCVKHPETGRPCLLLEADKNSPRCLKCDHRIRYAMKMDGRAPELPPTATRAAAKPAAGSCWWFGCNRTPHCRGLCRSHYVLFTQGRFTVWLNHTTMNSREEFYRTLMKMAAAHGIPIGKALVILIDEGARQYNQRFK